MRDDRGEATRRKDQISEGRPEVGLEG